MPRKAVKVPVEIPLWMLEKIDEWRKGALRQSRAQAIRTLIRVGLDREARARKKRKEQAKLVDGFGAAKVDDSGDEWF